MWYAFGWGDDWRRYVANAFRKMIPAAFEGRDSLELEFDPDYSFPSPVDSVDEEGCFPMGSFGYGGTKIVRFRGLYSGAAVSALDKREDDVIAGLAALYNICEMDKLSRDLLAA